MSKNNAIEIHLRIRPITNSSENIKVKDDMNQVEFINLVNKDKNYYINNSKDSYNFSFDNIYDQNIKQNDIFDNISKDIIDRGFEGYNGTIFAYGQTGSGKTYTMTGGKTYEERGIIPRSISYIYDIINKKSDLRVNVTISYMEIYNNQGYDLLNENHEQNSLEHLQKVTPLETKDKELFLKNLNSHLINNEEDALNLLFIGDTNRVVCDTPMNDVSTRSHCIFTITLECRNINSDITTLGKINLVDLSGSERVGKTNVKGDLLNEACNINLSLHHLERVIVSLQNRANNEDVMIPYRSSLMTMVLRDSLGGNCLTKMIFTMNPRDEYNEESISTCFFAQRVALIKNIIKRNEQINPKVVIERLKREISELKAEIKMIKGENCKEELNEEDKIHIKNVISNFIDNKIESILFSDRIMLNYSFNYLKTMIKNNNYNINDNNSTCNLEELKNELTKMKSIIKQRDVEISTLLKRIYTKENVESKKQIDFPDYDKESKEINIKSKNNKSKNQDNKLEIANKLIIRPINITKEGIKNKEKMFELFRINYRKKQAYEEDILLIKELTIKGKNINEKFKEIKKNIENHKSKLEQIRKNQGVKTILNPKEEYIISDEEKIITDNLKNDREIHISYHNNLKQIKKEIEKIKQVINQSNHVLKNDFNKWYTLMYDYTHRDDDISNTNYDNLDDRTKNNLDEFYKLKNQIN